MITGNDFSIFSSDYDSRKYFLFKLWQSICGAKQNMPAICTTRDGNDHSCEVSPVAKTVKAGQYFLFFALVAIFLHQSRKCRDMSN
jgi:hypothetical protein